MNRTYALIGVPSSAGAHWPGQEKAPAVLRKAGLLEALSERGNRVIDFGDQELVRYRPDRSNPKSLMAVVDTAERVADRVEDAQRIGATPLVIGGDCTVGIGTLVGLLRHDEQINIIYFDGHTDMNTPSSNTT